MSTSEQINRLRCVWAESLLRDVGLESPIEELFLLVFLCSGWHRVCGDVAGVDLYRAQFDREPQAVFSPTSPKWACRVALVPQHPELIEGDKREVRVDFLLITMTSRIAVELDGHDFHERTKEQAARDRSKDRGLLAEGYTVLRFTGSEIHADAVKCVRETIAAVDRVLVEEDLSFESHGATG
jgi:hypothetical protein